MTTAAAQTIATRLRADGFSRCTAQKVLQVGRGGSLLDDPALESAILQELDR